MGDVGDADDMGTPHLRFERRGPVAWCTIDRPEARNALTRAMYQGLGRALQRTIHDPELEALVLTGTGDAFVAGGDMAAGETTTPSTVSALLPFNLLRTSPVPVVTAINGACVASGLVMAMLSDVSVASRRATFRAPELHRGFPDTWCAAVLPHHVGMGRARDLMLTARTVGADEALAIGLVTRLAEHEHLPDAAEQAAYELLDAAPQARWQWKRAANAAYGVVDEMTLDAAATSPEVREGFQAFVERRPARWSRRRPAV